VFVGSAEVRAYRTGEAGRCVRRPSIHCSRCRLPNISSIEVVRRAGAWGCEGRQHADAIHALLFGHR